MTLFPWRSLPDAFQPRVGGTRLPGDGQVANRIVGSHVAILEILNGAAAGQRYELANGQTVLGRDAFCDVILPLRSISRQHARILAERGQFYIEDLRSLNGTFVNGQRVAARARLKDHDRIQLYETLIAFYETRPELTETPESDSALGRRRRPARCPRFAGDEAGAGPAPVAAGQPWPTNSHPARHRVPDSVGQTALVVNVTDAEAQLGSKSALRPSCKPS